MPNHVTTICTVTGPEEALATFEREHVRPEPDGFDFDTIIPRPESIKATESGSSADLGFFALTGLATLSFAGIFNNPFRLLPGAHPLSTVDDFRAWLEKEKPQAIEEGRKSLAAFRETGHRDWHSWSVEHWGTKWNSYSLVRRERSPDRLTFKFETAWSFPEPIFRRLAELYPQLAFAILTYDEGGQFACEGEFNGRGDYRKVTATPELYRAVYGTEPEVDEDEEEDETEAPR